MASISSLGVGSGLDLTGLLDQLASAERERLAPLVEQRRSFNSQISSYGRLESALSAFQSAVSALSDGAMFEALATEVTGSAVTAAASSDTMPGSYAIEVGQLARAYSIATLGLADPTADLGTGTISITQANGETMSVVLDGATNSLEDVRNAINAADGGVAATIVNDGGANPHRLVLAARETGSEAAITTVDFGDMAGDLQTDAGTETTALNANLTIDNIAIVSQSNTVEEAIQGVSLGLVEIGAATLEVRLDRDGVADDIREFVDSYNKVKGVMAELTSFDADTGEAGILLGSSVMRSVESTLRGLMTTPAGGGDINLLSDMGISLQLDGKLSVDAERLEEVVTDSAADLERFLAGDTGEDGFAGRIDTGLQQMLADAGSLGNATEGLETRIDGLDRRYERMEQSIDATIARYREQFSQLDRLIAGMSSTSDFLTQQFDNMNALTRGK